MQTRRLHVLLVDDHAVVRVGFRTLLLAEGWIEKITEAASGEAACRQFAAVAPDLVLMNLGLPGISGCEAIRRIVARRADARVLAFSTRDDTPIVEQALRAGALGFVCKRSTPETLLEAVHQVADGHTFLDPDAAGRLAVHAAGGRASPFAELSSREFEIFSLLAAGRSTAAIAACLSLSAKTVANHATQVKAKLAVDTLAELTRLAIRHRIIEP